MRCSRAWIVRSFSSIWRCTATRPVGAPDGRMDRRRRGECEGFPADEVPRSGMEMESEGGEDCECGDGGAALLESMMVEDEGEFDFLE